MRRRQSQHKKSKKRRARVPTTVSGEILETLTRYRNDIQDFAIPMLKEGGVHPTPSDRFRRQNFAFWSTTVQDVMRGLRRLNAVIPCSYCGSAGELTELSGRKKTCPVCKGTTWEPVI